MADMFGNTYWTARYFPAGYWGFASELPAGSMSASVTGASSLVANLTDAGGGSSLPVDFITGGSGFFRTVPRFAFTVHFNPSIPAFTSARIASATAVRAALSARANIQAGITAQGRIRATLSVVIGRRAQDQSFWLLAA